MEKPEEQNYESWIQKIKEASGIIDDKKEDKEIKKGKSSFLINILIFLLAFIPSLAFIFFTSGLVEIGWYADTFHHWQIAYLSKEIGFSHGFLRLWDLKGMEYFWGLLHPLVLSFLMTLTGSSNIILPRLLSAVSCSFSILVLFLIVKRSFGTKTAVSTALVASLNPVTISSSASGMVEPMGILFMLLGLYFWPKKAFASGLMFALASMTRAEYWFFSIGLISAILVFSKEHSDRKMKVLLSYIFPIGLYMKYLLTYAGNAFYPVWWTFFANAKGEWQPDVPLTESQIFVRYIFIAIILISLIGILFVVLKRKKELFFHLFGFGNFLFLGVFIGLTEYLKSYIPRFWIDRIFLLPYFYLAFLISFIIFYVLRKKLSIMAWVFVVFVLIASQGVWSFILPLYNKGKIHGLLEGGFGRNVGKYYKGGNILLYEGDPIMTYSLVNYGKIDGKVFISQMYDPFQYKPFTDHTDLFSNWGKDRKIVLNWLKNENIRLLIMQPQRERYLTLFEKEPEIFKPLDTSFSEMWIYEVGDPQ